MLNTEGQNGVGACTGCERFTAHAVHVYLEVVAWCLVGLVALRSEEWDSLRVGFVGRSNYGNRVMLVF